MSNGLSGAQFERDLRETAPALVLPDSSMGTAAPIEPPRAELPPPQHEPPQAEDDDFWLVPKFYVGMAAPLGLPFAAGLITHNLLVFIGVMASELVVMFKLAVPAVQALRRGSGSRFDRWGPLFLGVAFGTPTAVVALLAAVLYLAGDALL